MGNKRGQQVINTPNNSPNNRQLKNMAFGQPPNLPFLSTAAPDFTAFLQQLETMDKFTASILDAVDKPEIKAALQQLANISRAAGHLLRRESGGKEAMDEEKRLHCVVLTGLPESQSPSPTTRAAEDRKQVLALLDLAEVECLPCNVYRMGQKPGSAAISRPRLVKVELPTKKMARDFLSNRGKFTNIPAYKNVYVRPSMTFQQLARRKDLYRERHEKNALADNMADPYIVYGAPGKETLMKKSEIGRRQ